MKPFNREKFLFWLLAGIFELASSYLQPWRVMWLFTPQANVAIVCPELGSRYDNFVQRHFGAVLGLLAGAATAQSTISKPEPQKT